MRTSWLCKFVCPFYNWHKCGFLVSYDYYLLYKKSFFSIFNYLVCLFLNYHCCFFCSFHFDFINYLFAPVSNQSNRIVDLFNKMSGTIRIPSLSWNVLFVWIIYRSMICANLSVESNQTGFPCFFNQDQFFQKLFGEISSGQSMTTSTSSMDTELILIKLADYYENIKVCFVFFPLFKFNEWIFQTSIWKFGS